MEIEITILIVVAVISAFFIVSSIIREYRKEKNLIYIHVKTGNRYRIFQDCLMKVDGKWMDAIIYTKEENGEMYVREYNDFILNFKTLIEWEKEK